MMDDSSSSVGAEAAFPGWDEGGGSDNLAGSINLADTCEDATGDLELRGVGHNPITA